MAVTLTHMRSTMRPSLLPRNLIYFNFFLKSTIYNFVRSPDSSFDYFESEETIGLYAEHHQSVDRNLYEEEIAMSLDRVLATLLCDEGVREEVVEYGLQELRRVLSTASLCQNGCRFKVSIDLEMESVCYHYYYSPNDVGECRMVPAAESAIQSLDKFEVAIAEDQSCSICLEHLKFNTREEEEEEEEELMSMPCGHVFHAACIDKWLSISHNCPLCRFQMPIATP